MKNTNDENIVTAPIQHDIMYKPTGWTDHHDYEHIFEIPITNVWFFGTSSDSTEIVTDWGIEEQEGKFFTDFKYNEFASGKPRPIASMLNEVMREIEAFSKQDPAFYEYSLDSEVAKTDYELLTWYLDKLDCDYKHAAEYFIFFKNQLRFTPTFEKFPLLGHSYEKTAMLINDDMRTGGTINISSYDESGKEIIKSYSPDVTEPYSCTKSGKKHLMLPYSHLTKYYQIKSIWEYCLALCEHLSDANTLDIRLRRCKNCGKFYITPLSVHRSSYCSPACTAKTRKVYKQTFTEHQKIANRITRRLREERDIRADQQKKDFQAQNRAFKKAVKENLHTKGEYMQWLKEQDRILRLRKPKTPSKK